MSIPTWGPTSDICGLAMEMNGFMRQGELGAIDVTSLVDSFAADMTGLQEASSYAAVGMTRSIAQNSPPHIDLCLHSRAISPLFATI